MVQPRFLLLLLLWLLWPTYAQAGSCLRWLKRWSFSIVAQFQPLESRSARAYLTSLENRDVPDSDRAQWTRFLTASATFEGTLEELPLTFGTELDRFRAMGPIERRNHLVSLAKELDFKLAELSASKEFGFHYNKNGGSAADFVLRGGLLISHGNLRELKALTPHGGIRGVNQTNLRIPMGPPTLFFFQSAQTPFSDFLVSSLYQTTPRDVALFETRQVPSTTEIVPVKGYYGCAWSYPGKRSGEVGIPVESFILPPVRLLTIGHIREAFSATVKLSLEESELATLRHFLHFINKI